MVNHHHNRKTSSEAAAVKGGAGGARTLELLSSTPNNVVGVAGESHHPNHVTATNQAPLITTGSH